MHLQRFVRSNACVVSLPNTYTTFNDPFKNMARRPTFVAFALQGTSPLFDSSSTSPNDIKLIAQVSKDQHFSLSLSLSLFFFFLANFYTVVTPKRKAWKTFGSLWFFSATWSRFADFLKACTWRNRWVWFGVKINICVRMLFLFYFG